MTDHELYSALVARHGIQKQTDMLLEEMAVLQAAILHARRGKPNNTAKELADVLIMIEQMIFICDEENRYWSSTHSRKSALDWKKEKLEKMRKKVESWE
jgi:hypothetical protein